MNAAGRVGDASDAARLFLAEDPAEAEELAAALDALNLTRRELTKQVLAEARLAVVDATADAAARTGSETPPAAVLVRGPWPIGIVGLVAARLAEETGLPAVVGAEIDGIVRASCRSGGALDLARALEECGELFIRFGGHRGAAGFELEADRWPIFVERFEALASASGPVDPRPELATDLELAPGDLGYPLLGELDRLAPYGPGNPQPLLVVRGAAVARLRPVKGGHTQLTLRRERDVIDAIAFGRDDLAGRLGDGDRVDLVARLASRTFNGLESLQLEVRDIASAGWEEGIVANGGAGAACDPAGSLGGGRSTAPIGGGVG